MVRRSQRSGRGGPPNAHGKKKGGADACWQILELRVRQDGKREGRVRFDS